MRIYSQVRLGVTPEVNAISTLLLAFVGVALGLSALAGRPRANGCGRFGLIPLRRRCKSARPLTTAFASVYLWREALGGP